MDESEDWEVFVNDRLLKGGAITGVCLVSHQGVCLCATGLLTELPKTVDGKQFLSVFNARQASSTHQLSLHITGQGSISFQVHQQTSCSLYATSAGSHVGLLAGNLPHGVLVCTFSHREPEIGIAKRQFEHVCSLLRS